MEKSKVVYKRKQYIFKVQKITEKMEKRGDNGELEISCYSVILR